MTKSTDEVIDEVFNRPETEKLLLEAAHLFKLRSVKERLPTLADMEVVYPRLKEKIVFSRWLRKQATFYVRRKQQNPYVVKCPTCNQEVDRFDFIQIQGGLTRYLFNITDDDP